MKNLVLEFVKGVTLNLTDDCSVYRIVKCGDDRLNDNYKWSFLGMECNVKLPFIADTLACGEDEACNNNKSKQAKEEVTLEDKYSLWKVFLKGEDDFTYAQTKPTTISKAYKVIAKALGVSVGDIIGFIAQV